jgi:hypothetical protein
LWRLRDVYGLKLSIFSSWNKKLGSKKSLCRFFDKKVQNYRERLLKSKKTIKLNLKILKKQILKKKYTAFRKFKSTI